MPTIENSQLLLTISCWGCGQATAVPCTEEQFIEMTQVPRSERRLIQDIFPELSADARELLITGTCPACWRKMFGAETGEE